MHSDNKNRRGHIMWWIVFVVVCVIAAGLAVGLLVDAPNRKESGAITFAPVDFDNLHDGTFTGEWTGEKSHLRDTKVEVVVKDGHVANVTVLKGAIDKDGNPVVLKDGKRISDLLDRAVREASLQVDVISGATLTSKTHLKAMEQALLASQGH